MMMFTVMLLFLVLVVNGDTNDGFSQRCQINTTLFVPEGQVVEFHATLTLEPRFGHLTMYKGITIFEKRMVDFDILLPEIYILWKNDDRLNYTLINETPVITLEDVNVEDSGFYRIMYYYRYMACFELFVLDIWNSEDKEYLEENHPAYILALPPASRMVRPRVNATAIWLLDGLNATQSSEFLEQDRQMLIISMSRQFDGKNVTYKIQEDNGMVHEVNLTISVQYGPDFPLTLKPDRAFYHLSRGDVLPDITCSTDCKPSCQVTWDRSGVGNILRLGQVDVSSSGMYTCRAIRNTSDVVVAKPIYIEVTDNSTFIVAVALIGTVQILTLLGLGVCAVYMYRSSNNDTGKCKERNASPNDDATYQNEQSMSTIEMGQYDILDTPQSGTRETYENLRI